MCTEYTVSLICYIVCYLSYIGCAIAYQFSTIWSKCACIDDVSIVHPRLLPVTDVQTTVHAPRTKDHACFVLLAQEISM